MKSVGEEEIASRFRPHIGETETERLRQTEQNQKLSNIFEYFANTLDKMLPAGRAKSLALTELESAKMWATKAYNEQYKVVDWPVEKRKES